jgi:hypothetical protein
MNANFHPTFKELYKIDMYMTQAWEIYSYFKQLHHEEIYVARN